MADPQPSSDAARTVESRLVRPGREYISYTDGTSFTRRLDRTTNEPLDDWIAVEMPPARTPPPEQHPQSPSRPPTRHLAVVAEYQTFGEPRHWSLFSYIPSSEAAAVANDGRNSNASSSKANDSHETSDGSGARLRLWQVTGDAEFMRHDHSPADADADDKLASPSYAWHRVVSADLSDAQLARVDEIARAEPPPSAPNRAAVREHCQGWTVRVLRRLVAERIVTEEGVLQALEERMDPIRN